jgi:hypothetical protein
VCSALVVARRVVIWLGNTLVNTGQVANKAARQAIVSRVFHQFYSVSRWLIIALVVVFVLALVTGPTHGRARCGRPPPI